MSDEPKLIEKANEIELLKYFIVLVKRSDCKESVKACLFKLCALMCKSEETIISILRNKNQSSVFGTINPVIENYLKQLGGKKPQEEVTIILDDDINQSRTYLFTNPEDLPDPEGMLKTTAACYFALCFLNELYRREKMIEESNPEHIIRLLYDFLSRSNLPKSIKNVTLHLFHKLAQLENYKLYLATPDYLDLLIQNALDKNLPNETQKIAQDTLYALSSIHNVKQLLESRPELIKYTKPSKLPATSPINRTTPTNQNSNSRSRSTRGVDQKVLPSIIKQSETIPVKKSDRSKSGEKEFLGDEAFRFAQPLPERTKTGLYPTIGDRETLIPRPTKKLGHSDSTNKSVTLDNRSLSPGRRSQSPEDSRGLQPRDRPNHKTKSSKEHLDPLHAPNLAMFDKNKPFSFETDLNKSMNADNREPQFGTGTFKLDPNVSGSQT